MEFWESWTQELVEDVEVSFGRLLKSHPGLLQQICLDVSANNVSAHAKVDTNELALLLIRER